MKGRVHPKLHYFGLIVLFLAMSVILFTLYNRTFIDLSVSKVAQKKINSKCTPAVSTAPHVTKLGCSFYPLFPKETAEVDLLRDLVAWPETPPVPSNFSLNKTSDPAHSSFTILPQKGAGSWHVGDELEVLIQICDFHGEPKKSGGDVILARLHNPALSAGVAGQVLDHRNGSYSAVFALPWEGSAQVEVTLVHPSEAVTVLQKLTREQPDRIYFKSLFRSGSVTETTTCNVCLETTQQNLCNYTNVYTGDRWFCYKPKKLDCDARTTHYKGGFNQNLKPLEEKLFQSNVNMKVSIPAVGPANITVLPKLKEENRTAKTRRSGYYYQGAWRALDGTTVQQFNNSAAISQCLKGKVVHMFGDSTIRQWFEYFVKSVPDLKEFNLKNSKQNGPFMALDYARNTLVTFRCHGPPIRFSSILVTQLRYIANELDGLKGGTDTVVVIGIWSHFSTFPIEVYIKRLLSIRKSVMRLLARAPTTQVVIRTANPKSLTLYEALTNSDWYSIQRDKVLREIFKGVKVRLLDAWEMTLAHHLPHNLHPEPPIIKNMIDVLLSYICF
ncbi:NXPE family member 3 isoform X2 [Kryptolebias marmoratus]|uniref:Neurexophilin and PC-esterase domain family member 3 n=1 Tax=Kryptolebias marmoratus TaxID=37003 RepID=A0A3Q3A7W4_KRYMA|nr:NXPE family member 3 isoform X2 [Kryptolebias marmoratus]